MEQNKRAEALAQQAKELWFRLCDQNEQVPWVERIEETLRAVRAEALEEAAHACDEDPTQKSGAVCQAVAIRCAAAIRALATRGESDG